MTLSASSAEKRSEDVRNERSSSVFSEINTSSAALIRFLSGARRANTDLPPRSRSLNDAVIAVRLGGSALLVSGCRRLLLNFWRRPNASGDGNRKSVRKDVEINSRSRSSSPQTVSSVRRAVLKVYEAGLRIIYHWSVSTGG